MTVSLIPGKLYRCSRGMGSNVPAHIYVHPKDVKVLCFDTILPGAIVIYLESMYNYMQWHRIIHKDIVGWILGDLEEFIIDEPTGLS